MNKKKDDTMTTKNCSNCQHENPASEVFCEDCGLPLDEEEVSAPDTPEPEGKTCPGCGKPVSDDMKFCDGCAMQLQNPEPDAPPEPPASPVTTTTDPPPALADDDVADISAPSQTVTPQPLPDDKPEDPDTTDKRDLRLRVLEGMQTGKTFILYGQEMMIGREDDEIGNFPEIDLEGQDDGYVSRKHAILRIGPEGVTIEDLGHDNRTLVDRQPITPNEETPVREGQVIRVGKVSLILERDG
jgi:pSer/pThr/pTyr-binding forkhead associated (FHA) protein